MKQDEPEAKETDETPEADNVVIGRFGPRRPDGGRLPPPPGKTEEDTPAGEAIREWWRHLER